MSTRAQIAVYQAPESKLPNFEALLYRHSDGYPSGVLPDIMPFLAFWKKNRGMDDVEYLSARLLQYLCNEYDGMMEELEKGKKIYTGILGNGISKDFHGDIEYLYAISPEGVKVYETSFWQSNKPTSKNCILLGTVPIEGYEESEDYKKLITE